MSNRLIMLSDYGSAVFSIMDDFDKPNPFFQQIKEETIYEEKIVLREDGTSSKRTYIRNNPEYTPERDKYFKEQIAIFNQELNKFVYDNLIKRYPDTDFAERYKEYNMEDSK